MATIGTFSQKDGKWTGTIRTMTINVKAQMVPVAEKAEGGPDYRIFAGGAELGAAWREESKDGETPYLAVKLDDPGFEKPLRAASFEKEDDGSGVLVWNRQKLN